MSGVRPKGYIRLVDTRTPDPNEWKPKPEALELVGQVKQVLAAATYRVSVRFIFYRLVGNYGYPKTERDYKNLAELLVKARRAGLIAFHEISDSGTEEAGGVAGYESRASFLNTYRDIARYFRIDEMTGQPYHLELWSEDAGSVDMLAGIVRDYPVYVYSTGGFSSVTVTHEVAQRVIGRDRPTVFMHVGDYDPSGESIFYSMSQDIGAFVSDELGGEWDPHTGETFNSPDDDGPDFRPIRVALTERQAVEWDLETAPPKLTDSRSRNWEGETVQVQAMSEEQMEEVVTAAVEDNLDLDALERTRARSNELRDEMRPLIERAFDDVIEELGEE